MTSRQAAIALAILLSALPAAHARDAGHSCGDEASTVDIVECLAKESDKWEKAVDQAMQRATDGAAPEYTAAAEAAQDLWAKYRDANCLTYRLGEGTIAAILAAECRRRMAEQRYQELTSGIESAD